MMNQSFFLKSRVPSNLLQFSTSRYSASSTKHIKKSWNSIKNVNNNTNAALEHFDSLYGKVYGRAWPSMRLGLLSPKKYCAILNSFVETDEIKDVLVNELEAIDIQRYYKKHLREYIRWQLRQQIIENKKIRKRELMAKSENLDVNSISIDSIEVSDVSDSELRGAQTTDASDGGFSSAEDLHEMFSDRRMDDDEKYFINRASTHLSLNDYVPTSEFTYMEDVPHDLSYYEGYSQNVDPSLIQFKDEPHFEIDDHLKAFAFPRGNWSMFSPPQPISGIDLLPYYLFDGASILPILALDLRLDDVCADYCAAPGGKSLAMLMTLKPKYLQCNDISSSRLARLHNITRQYCPDINYVKSTLALTKNDAKSMVHPDTFDKILVDVPCSNDRNSVEVLDNNLFKRTRAEERLKLPSTQCDILKSALKSLKPNGSVIYSTCTMSPVENDGVVQKSLIELLEENVSAKFAVMNLKEAFRPLRGLFKFNTKSKYGQQVVPNICSNFGPMYISKIKRIS